MARPAMPSQALPLPHATARPALPCPAPALRPALRPALPCALPLSLPLSLSLSLSLPDGTPCHAKP